MKEGKYDELERLADEARRDQVTLGGTPRLHWFYLNLASPPRRERTEQATLEHFDRLRRWRLAKPESITPYVIEAEGRISYAFSARGTGWASTVTEEGWKVYAERLKAAQELVESAHKLKRDAPETIWPVKLWPTTTRRGRTRPKTTTCWSRWWMRRRPKNRASCVSRTSAVESGWAGY